MSQQDNFSGGFVLGAVLGGIAGGLLGAMLVNPRKSKQAEDHTGDSSASPARSLRAVPPASTEQNMEVARRSLEDKIAQLNDAIDDVRQQLGPVNGGRLVGERASGSASEGEES